MTTLREEIQNRIEIIQHADTEQIYPDEETDNILKLFEKVIDEKMNGLHSENYVKALKELKEELK
jgi:hypothetical protein